MHYKIYLSALLLCLTVFPRQIYANAPVDPALSAGTKVLSSKETESIPEASADVPPKNAQPSKTTEWFHGVGVKNGKFDTGFRREKRNGLQTLEVKESSGITLPSGVQKIVDEAERTIEDIDKATLNTVNAPLKTLGLEAESAKIRPIHDGVGLGISIKLDKKNKSSKKDKNEIYEALASQVDNNNASQSH